MDLNRRPSNRVSSRALAAMVEEIASRDRKDSEEVLLDLLWLAWPSEVAQDQ